VKKLSDEDFKIFLEDFMDLLNAQEASIVKMRMQIAKLVGVEPTAAKATVAAKEETFTCLKFEPQQGAKIGQYEVAYKANNIEDKWTQAFNILRQSNATINSRYHGEGYGFSYWLYGEGKIYRQKLKQK
jgi:hypothetical protein